MIRDLFAFLNDAATVIGWIAIIGGLLWLVGEFFKSSNAQREAQADYDNMVRFEDFLRTERPDAFKRYQELKREYRLDGEIVHWHGIAQEIGLPIIEIVKDRR